ncbi:MAG: Calx-beta domain-containing protein [Planctomycetaceae bacterium]
MLLSAVNDLASLSDEFTNATSTSLWQRVNEVENWNADQLQIYDINQTQPGRMVMAPHTVVWYQNWRGPMAFKEVTGDFVFTTQVHISDRDDVGNSDPDDIPDEAQFSLGGAMIRTPRNIVDPLTDWQPGSMQDDGTNNGENYVFMSMGHGTNGQYTFEAKSTRNSDSQLELTPTDTGTATIQLARIGDSVIAMLQLPGQDWVVHRRFHRPDLPETLQVGIVSYTDWSKAGDFDPFYHNGHTLDGSGFDATPGEAFNPDLVAGYEYARYVRPQVPAELQGVDLVNAATDEQLLSFLGGNANLPGDTNPVGQPVVSIGPAAGSIAETGSPVALFQITRMAEDLSEPLTVSIGLTGTATADVDFLSPEAAVVIPAGETSVTVEVPILDDSLVEGTEALSLTLLDDVFYEIAQGTASLDILDDDFEAISNVTMNSLQDSVALSLPASLPDGTPLNYSAQIVDGGILYNLDQQFDFHSDGNEHENWGGQNEKWIRGDGSQWFYLLPSGTLHRWTGSFATSELIADVGETTYHNPEQLLDAQPTATVTVTNHQMSIDPIHGFTGTFEIDITTSNGAAEHTQRISVTVEEAFNSVPVIQPVTDQSLLHDSGELRIPIEASDADGHPLSITATIVQSPEYLLNQQYAFSTSNNYHDNWGGQNERWIRSTNPGDPWLYLLPNGDLHLWNDSFADSPLIESPGTDVYNNPQLLTDAEAIPVSAATDGSDVIVIPGQGFTGTVSVVVSVSDGYDNVSTQFSVVVTNTAPEMSPIDDLMINGETGQLNLELSGTDVDGDTLLWSVEVIGDTAWQLDAALDLQAATNFHTNWGGQNEKWLQSGSGQWYFILPDGSFFRWDGSFADSQLLETLQAEHYDNPNLIADSDPLPVTATIVNGLLSVSIPEAFDESFSLLVTLSDGIETISELVSVAVVGTD